MKEIKDILQAYDQAQKSGLRCALATVVHIEGSSYRRPGARMLITEKGQLTGAISGGCLEGDALRKALYAIHQQRNQLVTYDTTQEDDLAFGVQLGCNGIVNILIEPIDHGNLNNPIELLRQLTNLKKEAVIVTLFSKTHVGPNPGTTLLYHSGMEYSDALTRDAREVLQQGRSTIKEYGDINAFIEMIPLPPSVVIAGAGNDVMPLVDLSYSLGWHTTVVDGRSSHATAARFPKADKVLITKPEQVIAATKADSNTIFLLMTHNYNFDLALLKNLTNFNHKYIGLLGPRKKLERMLKEDLSLNEQQLASIHSPVGLDIGAETAQEIAISIIAEIKAVLTQRNGSALKDRSGSIHNRFHYA